MAGKLNRRLGRGLDALISPRIHGDESVSDHPAPESRARTVPPPVSDPVSPPQLAELPGAAVENALQVRVVAIETLTPNPAQPRKGIHDSDIISLSDSIRQSGVLQPIMVRPIGDQLEIIAGERRWRAAKRAGLSEVPVLVREADDEQTLEWALIENIQREDLNPIDRAQAYREFCNRFALTPEQVGQRVGEDRSTVANYLRLLDLPAGVQQMVRARQLSMGHARCLAGVTDAERQMRLAESAAKGDLSVRALEELVRRERGGPAAEKPAAPAGNARLRSAHVKDLERRFEETVKTKVTIHEGKRRGAGRVVIDYYSLDDFQRLAELLGVDLD